MGGDRYQSGGGQIAVFAVASVGTLIVLGCLLALIWAW